MDVLISWSGQHSRAVASALRELLPEFIPDIKPWMSDEDISKGNSWFLSLLKMLEEVQASVICITSQNVKSQWLHFEAGAIAAKKEVARLFSLLVGCEGSEMASSPLAQYQWTKANKEDFWRLIRDINKTMPNGGHNEQLLKAQFDKSWRKLNARLSSVVAEISKEAIEEPQFEKPKTRRYRPSEEEIQILLKMAESEEGVLYRITSSHGLYLQVPGHDFIRDRSGRALARWQEAFDSLLANGLLQDREGNGQRFHLSEQGYDAADQIKAIRREESGVDWETLEKQMPELLEEMRKDLNINPLYRELIVLEHDKISYNNGGDTEYFVYFQKTHPNLLSKLQILENYGLIDNKTFNNTTRYGLTEQFVKYLLGN